MADMLESDPTAMQDIQEMLEKSNGNMFSLMGNKKFQSLANKLMQNPELMQMMSDPDQVCLLTFSCITSKILSLCKNKE